MDAPSLRSSVLVGLALGLLAACETGPATQVTDPDPPSDTAEEGQPPRVELGSEDTRVIYVPAYSSITAERGRAMPFAVTLSVRNVDPAATVSLDRVDYYDTTGRRVRRYVQRARSLRPLETAEFAVDTFDESGGSGANFLVYWRGPPGAHALLTETVMIGHVGTGYVAFTSRGVELEREPQLPSQTVPTAPSDPEPG